MPSQKTPSTLTLLSRLTWKMLGPFALALLTLSVVAKGANGFTGVDVGYFAVLGAMFLGRWLEFRSGHPQKATGESATAADTRRYLLVTGVLGLMIWVIANVLGSHWMTR